MKTIKPVLLQVNVTANWGSTGKIAEQIGQLAICKGWDSYIAYGRRMNPSKSKLIKIGGCLDVYFHYAVSRFFDAEGLASKRATRKLIKEIEDINPDVIHLHNIHDHYLNYPLLFDYLTQKDIPVVWTQHDQWATTGHCPYNQVGCEKWTSQCYDCPIKEKWSLDGSKRNYQLKKQYFSSVKNLTIVSVSDWLNSQISKSFLGQKNLEVIKNGVDIKVFKPVIADVRKRYGFGDKKIILGVASLWNSAKGLSDFVTLSKIISDDWIIVLVGKIEDSINCDKIICIERTQNQLELAEIYTAANVIVSLSSSETFGLTIAEAMACGTPAIVYDNTALPELVTETTGIIVKTGEIDSVLDGLSKFAEKKDNVSRECRRRAEAYFDKNKTYDSYISLYNKLLGGGKSIIIGVACPWSERKGLKDYLALSQLIPDNIIIVLVGLSEEQRKGLPQNVIGLGPTQSIEELVLLYSMADVVMNLSYAETFGMTTAEGLACGTPSIVYDVTASPELVTKETGLVVKAGDIKGVADAVRIITTKGKSYYSMNCRNRAVEFFDKDKSFQKYVSLYEALLAKL